MGCRSFWNRAWRKRKRLAPSLSPSVNVLQRPSVLTLRDGLHKSHSLAQDSIRLRTRPVPDHPQHGLMNPYSSVYTKPAEYGSANWQERMFEPMTCRLLILSTAQLALLVLMPWAIFASLSWGLMSLAVYLYPWLSHVMIVGTAMLVLLTVVAALLSRGRWLKKGSREDNHPRFMRGYAWWAALAVLSLIAFIAGSVVGSMIFTKYMKGYYDISNLDSYDNVDPSRAAGKQLLDAGRVIFVKGSTLQLKHAMAQQDSTSRTGCTSFPLPLPYLPFASPFQLCAFAMPGTRTLP